MWIDFGTERKYGKIMKYGKIVHEELKTDLTSLNHAENSKYSQIRKPHLSSGIFIPAAYSCARKAKNYYSIQCSSDELTSGFSCLYKSKFNRNAFVAHKILHSTHRKFTVTLHPSSKWNSFLWELPYHSRQSWTFPLKKSSHFNCTTSIWYLTVTKSI